jgi:hypothetical protein
MLPARASKSEGNKESCKQNRIRIILLDAPVLRFLITLEFLGNAKEEGTLDPGRFDVDPRIHRLEMMRLEKIASEYPDFPTFLRFPDNT